MKIRRHINHDYVGGKLEVSFNNLLNEIAGAFKTVHWATNNTDEIYEGILIPYKSSRTLKTQIGHQPITAAGENLMLMKVYWADVRSSVGLHFCYTNQFMYTAIKRSP